MSVSLTTSSMKVALALLIAIASIGHAAGSASFQDAGEVKKEDVESTLLAELTGKLRPGSQSARIKQFESELRSMYASLPKGSHGGLDHSVVRYALHRLLVERHGWFIKGLEPESDARSATSAARLKEWVPSYLQNILEERTKGRGFDLSELAAFAATLEDLVHDEAIGRLKYIYEVMELNTAQTVDGQQAQDLIDMFLMAYLRGGNFSAKSKDEANMRLGIFRKRYPGWREAQDWLMELEQNVTQNSSGLRSMDFASATQIAEALGAQYHTFNDLECRDLKKTLLGIEDKKHGRVALAEFYKMGLHTHWQFTEKIDYLRTLGALDESDPSNVAVIVPNYLGSRPQCLEASSFYAVCCRNECEDLMSSIESEIAEPTATAERIIELVSTLTSDTIVAPRVLSQTLVSRLHQVASVNGGRIPLHGRLFAQWMHHAFPRECPYPHAGGANPETPDEWMSRTGHDSTTASEEERMSHVSMTLDKGSTNSLAGTTDAELPWTDEEQLLIEHPSAQESSAKAYPEKTVATGFSDTSSAQSATAKSSRSAFAGAAGKSEVKAVPSKVTPPTSAAKHGIFDKQHVEEPTMSAAGIMQQFNRVLRTLVFSGVAIGLALVSRLAFPSRTSCSKKFNEQIIRGWWATLVLFLFPLVVICFDQVLDYSSSKEILLCCVSWGLAAVIIFQLRSEFSGFASGKKDDDMQHMEFVHDRKRRKSVTVQFQPGDDGDFSPMGLSSPKSLFGKSCTMPSNLKLRQACKDFTSPDV